MADFSQLVVGAFYKLASLPLLSETTHALGVDLVLVITCFGSLYISLLVLGLCICKSSLQSAVRGTLNIYLVVEIKS